MATETPLAGPAPAEVLLADPPLVRVIAQVQFPLIASVEKRSFIAGFQEAIRADYPALRHEQSQTRVMAEEGRVEVQSGTIWRFSDASSAWRVSLASNFLALETTRYSNRDELLERFAWVLGALETHLNPRDIDRLGVRYINRVIGDTLNILPRLVRPEVAGIMATPLAVHASQSIIENLFDLPDDEGQLIARWGLVPPGATVDPAAIEPINEPSWLLDLDVFLQATRALDVDATLSQARGFAERIYSFFRWAVTDEFLRRYGG